MKEFYLLIDDLRNVDVDVIARTVAGGKFALEAGGVTHLYLDNDLGIDQPMEGIDILNWARDNDLVPPNVFIISANPVAKKRMEDVLRFDLKYKQEGNWWRKV
jgi:hypothetical protein